MLYEQAQAETVSESSTISPSLPQWPYKGATPGQLDDTWLHYDQQMNTKHYNPFIYILHRNHPNNQGAAHPLQTQCKYCLYKKNAVGGHRRQ